jgi:hypothetical protein
LEEHAFTEIRDESIPSTSRQATTAGIHLICLCIIIIFQYRHISITYQNKQPANVVQNTNRAYMVADNPFALFTIGAKMMYPSFKVVER